MGLFDVLEPNSWTWSPIDQRTVKLIPPNSVARYIYVRFPSILVVYEYTV